MDCTKIYEVEVTGTCLTSITISYPIEADSADEAKEKASKMFKEEVDNKNNVIEILNIEHGYVGVIKELRKKVP